MSIKLNDREQKLIELHDAVTDKLLSRVNSGQASAAEFTAAINHLKSNGIDCATGAERGKLSSLPDNLPYAPEAMSRKTSQA